MKLKRLVSAFTSFVLAGSLIASNAVFASAEEEFDVWAIIAANGWSDAYWHDGAADNVGKVDVKNAKISDNGTATVKITLEDAASDVAVVAPAINLDQAKYPSAVFEVTECKVDDKKVDVDLSVKQGQVSWYEQTGDGMYMRGAGYNKYADAFIKQEDVENLTTIEFTVRLDLDGDGFEQTAPTPDTEKEPAKDEKPKEETKKPATSEDKNIPTISFDAKAWTNYVKLTPDASLAGLSLEQITTDSYQATSLVVKADMPSALDGKWPTYAGSVNDEDGNPMYPDAAEASENEVEGAFVRMGFELNATDFGLENFNGCTFEFYHLFNEAAYDALLNNAMYIYPVTELYEGTTTMPKLLKVDALTRENIDFYKKDFVAVGGLIEGQEPVTKLIFEIPFMKGYKGEVLRMDNIKIILPDGSVVANVDSYNSTFKPRNESDGKIKPGSASTVDKKEEAPAKNEQKEEKSGFNPLIIVVVLLVIGAIALVVVILIKNKNRYY